jgi:hypothetical protein
MSEHECNRRTTWIILGSSYQCLIATCQTVHCLVIDGLDLSAMVKANRVGSGSASYHPALLLGLLVYGYTTGVFSSRKLERATYDSVAFHAASRRPGAPT